MSNKKIFRNEDLDQTYCSSAIRLKKVVYWDGYGLNHPNSGIFNYARSLADELIRFGVDIHSIQSEESGQKLAEGVSALKIEPISSLNKRIFQSKLVWPNHVGSFLLKKSFLQNQKDKAIYHGLSNSNVPLSSEFYEKYHTVLTIHDLIPLIARRKVSFASYCQFAFYLSNIIKKVDEIICVSEWTKNQVLTFYPFLEGKVRVIPSGFLPTQPLPFNFSNSKKINILFVSRYEKYKRFDVLKKLIKKYGDKFCLTIITNCVGKKWVDENLRKEIAKGNVIVKSQLSLESVKAEFQKTNVYVHPSQYEGFCLPASEAISFGRPVVFTKGSGIDEVVSDKVGFGLDLNCSLLDWANAIESAYLLSKQDDFIDLIHQTTQLRPTWKDAATKLLSVYDSLLNRS